ncbi:Rab proteins geranylgeranyltransferase component A [Didymosphaeria variabile]|uniref:Rab proteins geranylgeranyltransferase n=1 Tax=Didymosphaeria variabile TaxID=1932322 RepID=A0A9W9CD67_9PLEO|nr:Rab proteins geranylgeranyltransferase component A [Didymosphaeria variabile]KAJ4356365.1 Rab proteins geranylgeranyltransferase component A [Didymosphaeria variabile]
MDTLDNTHWDVVIAGTGLQQSLLALALSRSDKKILHVDQNPYYSGSAAAFSIPEAEEWVAKVNHGVFHAAFAEASIHEPEPSESDSAALSRKPGRQYNLALAPEIIYSGSAFRRYLVTSQAHHQVAFLPVGSWWVHSADGTNGKETGSLEKVPNTREDLFGNNTLDFPAKRKLVKILRFILDYENDDEKVKWEQYRASPFSDFLSAVFKAPAVLSTPLLALTMSTKSLESVTTEYALPRIARHLRSIGTLGKFSALIPKYGGLDEFCQVACRACAVGGGVYVLGNGLSTSSGFVSTVQIPVESPSDTEKDLANSNPVSRDGSAVRQNMTAMTNHVSSVRLHLKDGEAITARWVVAESARDQAEGSLCKSVSIVSSALSKLFPPVMVEERPFQPGSAILIFPSGSLSLPDELDGHQGIPPVHVHIHSSESGECPAGQCVLYASTSLSGKRGFELLSHATSLLLSSVDVSPSPRIIWSMQYEQRAMPSMEPLPLLDGAETHFLGLPPLPLDLVVDDVVFDRVRAIWQTITNEEPEQFLVFKDREAEDDDL